MVINMGVHIAVDSFEIRIDLSSTISPNRHDIPLGALWITTDDCALLVVKAGYQTVHMTLAGELLLEHPGLDNFAAFGKWKLGTIVDGKFQQFFEADVSPDEKAS